MIIVCPECSTKYDIDPSRMTGAAASFRCARCQHVFTVENPGNDFDIDAFATPTAAATAAAAATAEEASRPVEPPQTEAPAEEDQVLQKQLPEETVEQQTDAQDDADQQADEDCEFSYESFQTAETKEESASDKNFSFALPVEETEKMTTEEDGFTWDDTPGAEDKDAEASKTSIIGTAESKNRAQQAQNAGERSHPLMTFFKFLTCLILLALIGLGVWILIKGPETVLNNKFFAPIPVGQMNLSDVEGAFIQNEQVGELFVIRGQVINNFNQPRAAAQVKGVLLDQNNKQLLQKTVFCGNPISAEELSSKTFAEFEKKMGNQFGQELSNMKIDSGETIPFVIVFNELPANISEFSVIVTSSTAADE